MDGGPTGNPLTSINSVKCQPPSQHNKVKQGKFTITSLQLSVKTIQLTLLYFTLSNHTPEIIVSLLRKSHLKQRYFETWNYSRQYLYVIDERWLLLYI